MNRLQHASSPYLLQHADNPVDWYPWGEEALRKARQEDRPILLSIGYSACHWCHVMAHESFEDPETARLMNELFVNIKVDREERPDLDSIYMQAVQTLTRGSGGWPLTVFLTPEGRPFYGGTYFPPEPRYGMPAFRDVLRGVADAYRHRRQQVEEVAADLAQALDPSLLNLSGQPDALNATLLERAFQRLHQEFDRVHGGFGGAPKFPQPMNLEFLLRTHARTGEPAALDMVRHTLTRMARGGIYDQIGGGFHRYSVDAVWLVPHFEKMLYDNAQLSRLYLHAWQVTRDPFFRRIAEEVYDYILREMTGPEGGFYSATDADSEGVEGKFFVWDRAELERILGEEAQIAITYWGVTEAGNFEGHNILHVPFDDDAAAHRLGLSVETLRDRLAAIKARLYRARAERVPPGLDDKVLTAWNGLMLASLAEAARVLGREDYRQAAVRNAEFLLSRQATPQGRLLRTYKDGQSSLNGYLEDYASLIEGLLELYQTTFEERYFVEARRLAEVVLARFGAEDGGFFDTSDDHEALIVRPRTLQDNATPSGLSMLCRNLIRLTAYTGEAGYEEAARRALAPLARAMEQVPQAFGEALSAVDMLVRRLAEVAVVGEYADARTRDLLAVIQRPYRPHVITALAPEGTDGAVPLLHARTRRDGQPTVYVCQNFACQMPVTTPEEVARLLESVG